MVGTFNEFKFPGPNEWHHRGMNAFSEVTYEILWIISTKHEKGDIGIFKIRKKMHSAWTVTLILFCDKIVDGILIWCVIGDKTNKQLIFFFDSMSWLHMYFQFNNAFYKVLKNYIE